MSRDRDRDLVGLDVPPIPAATARMPERPSPPRVPLSDQLRVCAELDVVHEVRSHARLGMRVVQQPHPVRGVDRDPAVSMLTLSDDLAPDRHPLAARPGGEQPVVQASAEHDTEERPHPLAPDKKNNSTRKRRSRRHDRRDAPVATRTPMLRRPHHLPRRRRPPERRQQQQRPTTDKPTPNRIQHAARLRHYARRLLVFALSGLRGRIAARTGARVGLELGRCEPLRGPLTGRRDLRVGGAAFAGSERLLRARSRGAVGAGGCTDRAGRGTARRYQVAAIGLSMRGQAGCRNRQAARRSGERPRCNEVPSAPGVGAYPGG